MLKSHASGAITKGVIQEVETDSKQTLRSVRESEL